MSYLLAKYRNSIAAYRIAFSSYAKIKGEREAMQERLDSLTEERKQLRAKVVESPALATDPKLRGQLTAMLGDHELASAALEGLTDKLNQARAAAANAGQHAVTPLPGRIDQARQLRQNQRQAEVLAIVESWGPGAAGGRLSFNLSEFPAWCRFCVEGERLLRTLTHSEINLLDPELLQAAVDFLAAEFEELTPPAAAATVEASPASDLKAAA